tara:strand:- start:154 stop:1578 length:1425 start_codon:yes stop_codon:yes gene_type:complete
MRQKLLLAIATIAFLTTNAQVTKLKEINDSGSSSSSPTNLFVYNNKIYFQADDSDGSNTPGGADLGDELWVTDGTEAGTAFLKDLRTGSDSSGPAFFFELNGTMYFSANLGSGNVLFSSDGTEAGTTANGGSFIFNPLELGGLIYYIDTTDDNGLYQFDGTTQTKVANVGTEDVNFLGAQFTSLNGKIIGYGRTPSEDPTIGTELYEYDPATDTYTLIKDIDAGTGDASISFFATIGNEVYLEADSKLWKTDGTTAGTNAVDKASAINGVAELFVWNGNLYFEGDDGSNDQLWKYDPVADTVLNVSNITGSIATGGNNHDPSDFAAFGSYLYYAGEVNDDTSQYLFRTNGTTSERVDNTIKDIDEITVLNGKLYFEGDDGTTGNELYSVDPSTLSTDKNSLEIIKVFPNPTSNFINIPSKLIDSNYVIYSIIGKEVQKGKITSEKISVATLIKGNYILKLNSDNNIITRKIIIE